jgi:hypothetical protein
MFQNLSNYVQTFTPSVSEIVQPGFKSWFLVFLKKMRANDYLENFFSQTGLYP